MAKWAVCSLFTESKKIYLKSTVEFNMAWLSTIYSEKAFVPTKISDGTFKTHLEYHPVIKHGSTYPYWSSTIDLGMANLYPGDLRQEFLDLRWEIIQYLLDNDWEPFSTNRSVESDGVGTGLTLDTVSEISFRKPIA